MSSTRSSRFGLKARPPSLKICKTTQNNSPSLPLPYITYKRGPSSVSILPHHHLHRYSMASLALDFDSPNFEYFPPTPSPSDDETGLKSRTVKPSSMSTVLPATIPNGGAAPQSAPSKVTLHLGHLPSKKDIKGPWPRTPTRVSPLCFISYTINMLLSG